VFAHSKTFEPSPMFVSKARAYPSEAPFPWIGSWGQCYKTFYGRDLHIFALSQSVCKTRLEKFANGKHSSLLRKFVNYGQKCFITLGPGLTHKLTRLERLERLVRNKL